MTDLTTPSHQLVADLARAAAAPTEITAGGRTYLTGAYPDDWTIQTEEITDPDRPPARKTGKYVLADVDSFLTYIQRQTANELAATTAEALPSIYLDPARLRARAIFDDHTADGAGHRDHTAELALTYSAEWDAWATFDRKLVPAPEFADFIDEWRHTISDPPTADLLDLVRNFRATKKVTYGRDIVEKSGDITLEWSEETTAGHRSGTLEIPEGLMLIMAPFDGAAPVQLRARFRYKVDDGMARFGVILEQPVKLIREAFDAEVARIREAGAFDVMVGWPDLTA